MSVANQANEKLTQLVTLTAKIESYLNPSKKGKGGGQEGAKATEGASAGGGIGNRIKEAIAVGGMAQSLAMFFKEYRKSKLGDGQNVKSLLINLSEGIKEAADRIKDIDEKEMLGKIGAVIKGIAGFSLTMILLSLAAVPFALGILVFSLGISAMNFIFSKLIKDTKKTDEALGIIGKIGQGAALFSLTMILIGYTAPLFAIGVVVFTLAISAMILVFSLLSGMKKQVKESLTLLLSMSKDIAFFALTMTLIGLVAPLFALGAIVFSLGLGLIMTTLYFTGKFSKEINKGLKTLTGMYKPIAILSVVLFLVGLVAEKVAIGAIVAAGSILLLGLAAYILGKVNKEIVKGSTALDVLGVSLILFSVGLFILALAPGDPLTLALKMAVIAGAIVVLGLAAYVLGQPAVFPFVLLGAVALVALSLPLIIFSAALLILSLAKFEKEQADNLAYTIVELGIALAKFGFMAPFALIGSAVLAVASVALLPLTASLAIFKTIGWKESDGDSLKNALQSTVQAFAHALDGIGLRGMFKLLAAIPIVALLGLALTSLAMGIKAMATMTFTEMEWDDKEKKLIPKRQVKLTDAEIQAVGPNVAAILGALAGPLTMFGMWASAGESGGFFGIGGSSGYMKKGIEAAANVGGILGSLAKGVADMANLNVIEWEVKKGKLVPKSVRKLNPFDFIMAGINTGLILDVIAAPLVRFGESAEKGEGLFSSGYLTKGVEAAKGVGDIIGSLAKSVADMAQLNIVEYEVVGAGTKNAKLVPKSVRKLNPFDFIMAGINTGLILTALVMPLTEFGKAWKDGSGWFSNSYLESAVEGINAITDPIAKLAKMVTELAAGRAVINEVKDGKVVPKDTISFADAVPKAYEAVSALLTGDKSLPAALVAFGEYYEENEDPIEYAIDGLGYVFDLVKKVADVGNLYNSRKADMDGALTFATEFLPGFLAGKLLYSYGLPFSLSSFGSFYQSNEETINASKAGLDSIQANAQKLANIGAFFNSRAIDIASAGVAAKVFIPITKDMLEVVRNYNAMQKLIKEAQDGGFFSFLKSNFGLEDVFKDVTKGIEELNPGLAQLDSPKIATFSNLTRVIERLARASSPFQRFTKAFGVFSKDMGVFVKNWKQFSGEDAKNFKIYGDVTEKISKVDVGKLKEALTALVKYEKDKLTVEKERAVIVKDIMAGAGDDPAAVMQKLSDFIDSLTGSSETTGGEGAGGKGGPITTPRIQVNGDIIVAGSVK